jgi:hypothetical protein
VKKVTALIFNKKALTLLFFLISTLSISKAQIGQNLMGEVIDLETRNKVSNAILEIYDGKNLLFSVITNPDGSFTIPSKFWNTNKSLKITGKNYYDLTVPIKDFKLKLDDLQPKNNLGYFEIKPKPINLKEVLVKARKRYRDTTVIQMSNQIFERSVMIDDIFAQKGLYKGSNGQLYYNGKLVSEIVVNGSEFFGKNNLKIYDKIPALILDNIEITETNIDSTTNTTLLTPEIKVNLKIKEKYDKGKFGSTALGLGTRKRQLLNADVYTYRKQQQISLIGGVNNIGIQESLGEPALGVSVSGNNANNRYLKFSYQNLFVKKIQLNFQSKVSNEDRRFFYESERNDEIVQQYSKTSSFSQNKTFNIDNFDLNINYRIDSLNSIKNTTSFRYSKSNYHDSLFYQIQSAQQLNQSLVSKQRNSDNQTLSSQIVYDKRFNKKGRLIQTLARAELISYGVNETAMTLNTSANSLITGISTAKNNSIFISNVYTEPLNEDSYMRINASYKNDVLQYSSNSLLNSFALSLNDTSKLVNSYYQTGFRLQRTFRKTAVDGMLNAIVLNRHIYKEDRYSTLLNWDASLKVDRRINTKKSMYWLYALKPTYPNVNQLTNINTSFDLIYRIKGNIELKPEVKHQLSFAYDYKKSDSLTYFLSAEANYYSSRFGFNSSYKTGEAQNITIDNIGQSKAANLTFLVVKVFPKLGSFNYNFNLNYNEQPNILNNIRQQTNGVVITQTISTTRSFKSNKILISPVVSVAYGRYVYNGMVQSSFNLMYTDKYTLKLAVFEAGIFPFVNMVTGMNNTHITWSLNSELRKKVLKNYGLIWFKANDIFNSFNYQLNNFGPSFTQSIKYSNLSTYFLLGINYKFNNIK